jgi:hypothetical protein
VDWNWNGICCICGLRCLGYISVGLYTHSDYPPSRLFYSSPPWLGAVKFLLHHAPLTTAPSFGYGVDFCEGFKNGSCIEAPSIRLPR